MNIDQDYVKTISTTPEENFGKQFELCPKSRLEIENLQYQFLRLRRTVYQSLERPGSVSKSMLGHMAFSFYKAVQEVKDVLIVEREYSKDLLILLECYEAEFIRLGQIKSAEEV